MHVSACWAVAHVSCINVASMALKINIFIAIAMENHAQQQARAPSKSDIPKWEQLPNWVIVIQTHLLQSMPPPPRSPPISFFFGLVRNSPYAFIKYVRSIPVLIHATGIYRCY